MQVPDVYNPCEARECGYGPDILVVNDSLKSDSNNTGCYVLVKVRVRTDLQQPMLVARGD